MASEKTLIVQGIPLVIWSGLFLPSGRAQGCCQGRGGGGQDSQAVHSDIPILNLTLSVSEPDFSRRPAEAVHQSPLQLYHSIFRP